MEKIRTKRRNSGVEYMKRKITELEQKLINDGWQLVLKRYQGKKSEKVLCYEYHKTSDLRNNNKTYDQVIQLDQKRSQIVNYGIKNVVIDFLNDQELCLIRFLHLELRHYVEKLTKREPRKIEPLLNKFSESDWHYNEKQELPPMTPEQLDEYCKEIEENEKY